MADPLSTDDAVTEVESLEDKILLDEGKQGGEDLTSTSVRLEESQVEYARFVKAKMNTKMANVFRCAIHHGEKVVREEIGESAGHNYIEETEKLWIVTTNVLRSEAKCPRKLGETVHKLQTLDHGVDLGLDHRHTENPTYLTYNESVGSAIHDTWVNMANESQSSALRNYVSIGLGYSEDAETYYAEDSEEALGQAIRMFRSVREYLEMCIADYVANANLEWATEGYSDEEAEIMRALYSAMTTDYAEKVRVGMENAGMHDGSNPQISSGSENKLDELLD